MEFEGYAKLMKEYYDLQEQHSTSVTEAAEIAHKEQSLISILTECYNENNKAHWDYAYCPWFTEFETQEFGFSEAVMSLERSKKLTLIEPNKYKSRIKDLETQLRNTEDPDEINDIQSQMKAYGWNPEMEFNEANQEAAKRRILEHYNKELQNFYIIDARTEVKRIAESSVPSGFIEYSGLVPINLFVSPFGCYIRSKDLHENVISELAKYDMHEGSVYNFYCTEFNSENFQKAYSTLEVGYDHVGFAVPNNVLAARVANIVYEFCDISLKRCTPIIKKLYEGQFSHEVLQMINEFNHYVTTAGIHCYSEITHESMVIPVEAFYSMNPITDQLPH